MYYLLPHTLPQLATHKVYTLATSVGQATMQSSRDPGHGPLEAFPPAPPRAYIMVVLGCLVVVLVVLGCLVVFLALFSPPGAPPPTISTDSESSKHRL